MKKDNLQEELQAYVNQINQTKTLIDQLTIEYHQLVGKITILESMIGAQQENQKNEVEEIKKKKRK